MFFMPMRRPNPEPLGNGWQSMGTAPKDGTVVEICCTYGVAPWYGLYCYKDDRWQRTDDERSGFTEDNSFHWRPYSNGQSSAQYVDPTGGAQNTRNYWLHACGHPPAKDGYEDFTKPNL